jgi:hypothetical protein
LVLTAVVACVGAIVYLGISFILRSEELGHFSRLLRKVFLKHKVTPIPQKEPEPVAPTPVDTSNP